MVKIYSISLGCPKNRVDTEVLVGLTPGGAVLVERPEEAEVVLINTCSFIEPAVEESVGVILETAEVLADLRPKPLLVVAGCLPARYGAEVRRDLPEVDAWIEPDEPALWPELLARTLGLEERSGPAVRALSTPPGYAYLKIAEGCNNACRYCTIPSIRGPLKSRDPDGLAAEARNLLARGVSELALVAQDLTAYGRDLGGGTGLVSLLERLLPLDGLERLRLMYLYPSGISEALLSFMKEAGPKLPPYFDIPFQHVHPEVLAAMGRPRSAGADEVVERVRAVFPEAALRTTFIVGYPGETEAQFQALYDFVARRQLHHVGVFPFYAEEGTPAAAMPGQLPDEEKRRRRDAVMSLQRDVSAGILAEYVGKTLRVMVDAPHPEWPGLFVGRTWMQAPEVDGATYVSGPELTPGDMVEAEIVEAKEYDLVALV